MASKVRLAVIVLLVASATFLLAGTDAARISRVDWQTAPPDSAWLTLTFEEGVPHVEVTAENWGLGVWLPGAVIGELAVEGVRAVREEGGTRLRIEQAGIALRAVQVSGAKLELEVSLPEADAGKPPSAAAPAAYLIGSGDVVSLLVYKNPDLSGDFTVGPDGTISLPLVGAVPAIGRTEGQLAGDAARILAKDYLVDPQVTVTVKTYQSKFVYVTGSVGRATRVPLRPGMLFKDVLSEAGVALLPGQELVLNSAGGTGESRRLGASDLDAPNSPVPCDGDVLTVQEPRYVYIRGEVRRQGRLVLTPGLTLLQAITMAEGLTDWASTRDIKILGTVDGQTEEQSVNLKKVEARSVPDPPLQPDDVVLVNRRIL